MLNGKLDLHKDAIRALNQGIKPWEGKTVRVTVRRARETRSNQQSRYLWGVVYALIADHTGYTAEEVHEAMKALHLPKALAFAGANGEVVNELVIGGSTTRLNTVEMTDYIDAVRAFALDKLGVVIPLPNENY